MEQWGEGRVYLEAPGISKDAYWLKSTLTEVTGTGLACTPSMTFKMQR